MTRAALLVVVLAALCYTSQAIPVQTENAQVELPDEITEFLNIAKEKFNDFVKNLKKHLENLEHELQVAKFEGASRLQEIIESIEKLLREGKINRKEALAIINEEKEKIETDYQVSLSINMKVVKPLIKIGSKIIAPIVKNKVQEMWNKRRSGTYGISGNIGDIMKKIDEMFREKAERLTEKLEGLVEEGKKVQKSLEEMMVAAKEKANNIINDITDKVKGNLKDMKNPITGEKYQQPQQALIGGVVKGIGKMGKNVLNDAGNIVDKVLDNTGTLIDNLIGNVSDMIKDAGNEVVEKLKPKEKKKPEDGNKTDKSEEKENNIEEPGKEKENNIEVSEQEN